MNFQHSPERYITETTEGTLVLEQVAMLCDALACIGILNDRTPLV